MEILSAAAIIELNKVKKQLLTQPRVGVNCKASWFKAVLRWCDEHEIELGTQESRQFWISRAGLLSIEHCLQLHGQGNLASQVETRLGERSTVSSSNEKIAQITPMQSAVLCASCDLGQRLNQQQFFNLTDPPAQVNVELDSRHIELSHYDYLVVIENRDSFNDWHSYLPFTQGLANALVVYRGHEKAHSKGCKALKARWQQAKGDNGLVYFGDADIAGLGLAMAGEVPYQHLLLPSLSSLKANLDPAQVNAEYDYSRRNLKNQLLRSWLEVYEALNQKAALRQQHMYNLPLVLY